MELTYIHYNFQFETHQFERFSYNLQMSVDVEKEQIIEDLRSHFKKLQHIIVGVLKKHKTVSPIGIMESNKYRKGIRYISKKGGLENYLDLEYNLEMSGMEVREAGLLITHQSKKEAELLQIYDAMIDLDGLSISGAVQIEMRKIAIQREGGDIIDDLLDN